MALSTAAANAAVDAIVALGGYVSLHSADPGTTGANEISGGSPAYARKSVTWPSASSGASTVSTSVVFDVPTGATVSHFGLWSASSGGSYAGGGALVTTELFGGQGTYTFTTVTVSVS